MANLLASSHTSPVSASYFTLGNVLSPASILNKPLWVGERTVTICSLKNNSSCFILEPSCIPCLWNCTAHLQLPVRDSLKFASGKQILLLNLGLHLEVAVEWLGFKIASTGLLPGSIWIPYLRAFSGELQQVINFHQQTVLHRQDLSPDVKHIFIWLFYKFVCWWFFWSVVSSYSSKSESIL